MARRKKDNNSYSADRVIRGSRLDNTANLFPAIAGENATNVYRISVTLFEKIDPEKMQKMADAAYDVAAPSHTWANRTAVLAKYIRGEKQAIPAGAPGDA